MPSRRHTLDQLAAMYSMFDSSVSFFQTDSTNCLVDLRCFQDVSYRALLSLTSLSVRFENELKASSSRVTNVRNNYHKAKNIAPICKIQQYFHNLNHTCLQLQFYDLITTVSQSALGTTADKARISPIVKLDTKCIAIVNPVLPSASRLGLSTCAQTCAYT